LACLLLQGIFILLTAAARTDLNKHSIGASLCKPTTLSGLLTCARVWLFVHCYQSLLMVGASQADSQLGNNLTAGTMLMIDLAVLDAGSLP
jgi:hypothetical protein